MTRSIPIDRIQLDHRDDIALMIISLMNNDIDSWKAYVSGHHRKRLDHQKLFDMYSQAKRGKKFTPITVVELDGWYYAVSGAHRIGSWYAAGHRTIPARITGGDTRAKHLDKFSVNSSRFDRVSHFVKGLLLSRKKVLHEIGSGKHKRFGKHRFAYHSVPMLGIHGQRDCIQRAKFLGLQEVVLGKNILDIGSNMGMMSIWAGNGANSVLGIEPFESYFNVSNCLQEIHMARNVKFQNIGFKEFAESTDRKFDVIMGFAVSNWVGYDMPEYMQACRQMLEKGGVFIFESHNSKSDRPVINSAKKSGFVSIIRGKVPEKSRFLLYLS